MGTAFQPRHALQRKSRPTSTVSTRERLQKREGYEIISPELHAGAGRKLNYGKFYRGGGATQMGAQTPDTETHRVEARCFSYLQIDV